MQQALARARARGAGVGQRIWPHLARLLVVGGLFLATSWAWAVAGAAVHRIGPFALILFAALLIAALVPLRYFRWPTQAEALARLDRTSGLAHRPGDRAHGSSGLRTGSVDAGIVEHAPRARLALRGIRAGLPSPRLAWHDPWAVRAGVVAGCGDGDCRG